MEPWLCCRTCLSVNNLNSIFSIPEHHEKYSEIILNVTGIKITINDSLPQHMCTTCINLTNEAYKFRRKCQESEKTLTSQIQSYDVKLESNFEDKYISIDISDLVESLENDLKDESLDAEEKIEEQHNYEKPTVNLKKKRKKPKENQKENNKKERVKEEIECEHCHKILTSKLSLRNHYKIHTGFDVVCEHCGKKFITRRLLLMHCKAKHGYEKTDKCSFCDYRASNAEQVKIHERLHTGERPYVCNECGSGFHRKSSYLQHVAIHLPEKTVQCDQCPARFKSVTLMRIHKSRHRGPQYIYKCRICDHQFARRRNVVRHLLRIHSMQPEDNHIDRAKCA